MNSSARSARSGADVARTDVVVVGGGINGVGIARDLAGRGASVVLVEQSDLGRHTSSASTKLIHGGLRYLEYYEFNLVRKALAEREGLLRSAPHIMRPLRFVMPHDPSMRPVWMIRAGLFLYDHLARREWLPGSGTVDLRSSPLGEPLRQDFSRGFVYSDGWVDDARLVVLNALDAAERGADVRVRCRCVGAERVSRGGEAGWRVDLLDAHGRASSVFARALVNAAGPWTGSFLSEQLGQRHERNLRLVKGSHIVVPRIFEHDHAYLFQNPDRRIIFAIPYEGQFTLIGTTDVEVRGAPDAARIDDSERRYLCEQASRYFARPVREADIVWTYAGVRPLLDDEAGSASAVTRDYLLEFDEAAGAPLLSIWGGKLTTFRKLAEEAVDVLLPRLGGALAQAPAWTRGVPFPGGDLSAWIGAPTRPDHDIARFAKAVAERHPELPPALRERWVRSYGSRIDRLLAAGALGAEVAPGLHEGELDYLHREEWARTADDVLWRRSKLGLHYSAAHREAVTRWWAARHAGDPAWLEAPSQ